MRFQQLDGGKTEIGGAGFQELRTAFRGRLIACGDPDFNEARRVWNGTIDRRPALIAQCSGTADVIAGVNFASRHGLLVAVRGGGHSIPGHSVCDGGLVIDLSRMRGVDVDPRRRTLRAQGGALWGDVDHESQAFGLATPGGMVSTTGIAGLTLGSGSQSWLIRKYGNAADNLLSAEVVTATGELVTASDRENPDLFWALRGGGGNFGVVTSFEYQLHNVGPAVLAGGAFFAWERAREITDFYLEYVKHLPEELTTALFYRSAPAAPFLPASIHGQKVVSLSGCYAGPLDAGETIVAPIRRLKPTVDLRGPMRYTSLQAMFDTLVPKGTRAYMKSDYFDEVTPEMVEDMLAWAETKPGVLTMAQLHHYGGALSRRNSDATPFAHRDAAFAFSANALWTGPEETTAHMEWSKGCWQAMRSHSPRGAYVNFLADEGQDRIRESYQGNFDRLVEIKRKYDPSNLFRLNQNIKP